MTTARAIVVALAAAVGTLTIGASDVQAESRQYYSSWKYNSDHGYWYRTYYYKPKPVYTGYQNHYCIWYSNHNTYSRQYVYYYNPYKKTYWGRYDLKGTKDKEYSLLAEKDRKQKLEDIDEKSFPKPAKLPEIPESDDKVQMEAPPKELPKEDK